MGAPVVHFEVVGKDAPALRKFYSEAFDWQVGPPMEGVNVPDYTVVKADEKVGVEGGIGSAPPGYDGHAIFYVGVTDVGASLRRIIELGGKTMMGPEQVPGGPIIGLFEDPEAHLVGLVQIP